MQSYLKVNYQPKSNPKAIVQVGPVRFTILTSKLIRLEYDPSGVFEDRPSQVFWFRNQPVPEFQTRINNQQIRIETSHLILDYQIQDFGFYHRFLKIKMKDIDYGWEYGQENNTNLFGTVRTLDRVNGAIPLNPGLLSRTGWSLVDDSNSLVFNPEGWLETRQAHPETKDLYFFGYGKDYTECIVDFQKLSGPIPVLPRFALGNWWSRYWEYHQDELIGLMKIFRDREIPISVCIVDMDWHITDTGNESSGWTGYTWNPDLFPEPQRFLDELKEMNINTALNLHPASGVYPHEAQYLAMAKEMGINPESNPPIAFDIADPQFTDAYFKILHHPLEEMGVDFWWLDWQQGTRSKVEGLDPLFWLNHLHFYDLARDRVTRPFIFSRWGGLGSQRYPIGFSGDTFATWETLQFQPYFTATAANVGYGWWSHDIGGHMGGTDEPELYLRWVQYGVFSPILRIHTTKNPFLERHPWGFDAQTEIITSEALKLRQTLIPYLYTAAWINHKQGILPIRPMYHLYPDDNEAYQCPNQYTFGSELIVIPFTTPRDNHTLMSRQVVWLPEGHWYDFFTGEHFQGGGWHVIYGNLNRIPVFAKAGAIIPLGPSSENASTDLPDTLTIHCFPGAENTYTLYEDDGTTQAYLDGAYALTKFEQKWQNNEILFTITPDKETKGLLPSKRLFKLVFYAIHDPGSVFVRIDGKDLQPAVNYELDKHQLVISDLALAPTETLNIQINHPDSLLYTVDNRSAQIESMLHTFKLDTYVKLSFWEKIDQFMKNPATLINFADRMQPSHLLALVETWLGKQTERISKNPEEAFQRIVDTYYP